MKTDNDDIFPISFQKKDDGLRLLFSLLFGVCTIFFLHVKEKRRSGFVILRENGMMMPCPTSFSDDDAVFFSVFCSFFHSSACERRRDQSPTYGWMRIFVCNAQFVVIIIIIIAAVCTVVVFHVV